MSIGSSGLGFGVAFELENKFSNVQKEISKDMDKLSGDAEKMAAGIEKSMSQIKTGVVAAGIGAAIVAPFAKGVQAASTLQENITKTEAVFGEMANEVKAFADTSSDAFGVAGSDALDMAALFGDMGTSVGLTQKEMVGMSQSLVGLAGDLVSFKDIDIGQAQNALKGIFTGQARSLQDLGVVMNQNTLTAFAHREGITKSFKSMSEAEKVALRYKFVLDATKNAQGDYTRTAGNFANAQRGFQNAMGDMSETLGTILLPMLSKAMIMAKNFLQGLKAFADSPVGQTILKITVALGALLTVGGLVLTMMGGMRLMAFKLAGSFNASAKAKFLDIIATKGVTSGLKAMGIQASKSLIPMGLMAAKFIAIAALAKFVFDTISAGFKGFNEMKVGDDVGGISGFFIKLAGIVKGVMAIFNSWNGEVFTLTETMAQKLESLGILEFVIALGTWAIRVKEFFKGVFEGLSVGFSFMSRVISELWATIQSVFSPLGDLLESIGFSLDRNTSSIDKWKTAGKVAGIVLVGLFTSLAIAAAGAAISMIIAFAPVILTIGAIALGIGAVIAIFWALGEAGKIALGWIASAFNFVIEHIFSFMSVLFNLPNIAFEIGANFVQGIWDGIKSIWGSLTAWFSEKWEALTSVVTGFFGEDEAQGAPITDNTVSPQASPEATHHAITSKNPSTKSSTTNNTTNNNSAPVTTQLIIDGDVIAEKMIDKMELRDARQG